MTSSVKLRSALGVRELSLPVLRQLCGFSPEDLAFLVISPGTDSVHPGAVAADEYQLCANLHLAQCNWLVKVEPVRALCTSCQLTRTRPADRETPPH